MKMSNARNSSLIFGSVVCITLFSAAAVRADNPSWEEQQARNREMTRQALQQQAQQGPSPQVLQGQRWEQEWRQQHPNEPMPSFGALEKMHRGEIMQNMNAGFARMRQNRQAELQRNYLMAKQRQESILAGQHITWTSAQWANWNQQYDQEQHQRANDYLEGVRQAGEMERREQERKLMFGQ